MSFLVQPAVVRSVGGSSPLRSPSPSSRVTSVCVLCFLKGIDQCTTQSSTLKSSLDNAVNRLFDKKAVLNLQAADSAPDNNGKNCKRVNIFIFCMPSRQRALNAEPMTESDHLTNKYGQHKTFE